MKNREFLDIRELMDEIFEAAEGFRKAVENEMGSWKNAADWGDHRDYYPAYSYPPMNVYMTEDKSLVFQFALAGFREQDVSLEFRGDYLYFSANAPVQGVKEEGIHYFKRRLKFKGIQEQKYFVPEDRFDREAVKAVFAQSILTVTIPAKAAAPETEGIRVTIVTDDETGSSQAKA